VVSQRFPSAIIAALIDDVIAPHPMLKKFLTLAMMALFLLLSGCGSLGEKPDPTKGWSADKLYAEAKDELKSGNYERAIKYLEKLESRYPFGKYAQQAQMEIAYSYYRQNDQAQCLAAVDRFIRLHPNHVNVDYMYYLRGLANFNDKKGLFDFISRQDPTERDPKAARQAFDAFKQLADRFPESKYADDARDRLRYLVEAMAQYEVHVADYYLRRSAFVAAINRAQTVIREYPASPSVRNALRIQIRAYDALGMTELRDDAERVFQLNYKTSSAAQITPEVENPWWKFWGK
jgi:outer membrane protein assembly factor BamD